MLEDMKTTANTPNNVFMELHHSQSITALSVWSEPLTLFSGSLDNTIQVWELNEFSLKQTLVGHTRSILALKTIPYTGKATHLLISSSADRTLRFWACNDEGEYTCVRVLCGYAGGHILSMCSISNDLYFGGQDGALRHCRLESILEDIPAKAKKKSTDLKTLTSCPVNWDEHPHHHGYIYDIVISKSLGLLFTCSSDGTIQFWSYPSLERQFGPCRGHRDTVHALAIATSLGVLFSAGQDKTIRAWNISHATSQGVLKGHTDAVLSVRVVAEKLYSSSADLTLRIWDAMSLHCLKTIDAHKGVIPKVHNIEHFIFTGSIDGSIKVWDNDTILQDVGAHSVHSDTDLHSHALLNLQTDASMIRILKTFVSFQSVSGDPSLYSECWQAAKYVKSLLQDLGAECQLEHCGPGVNPIVIGKLGNNPHARTILICGHYDVQPASFSDGWDTPPFTLTGRNGYLYGRGATDDKGPVVCLIFAIRELLARAHAQEATLEDHESESCVPNFLFLIQGESENNSIGFQDAVEELYRTEAAFQSIDLIFISNNYWIGEEIPCLTYGMRGCLELELEVQGPQVDLHAGVDGNVVREPYYDLILLLNSLYDPKTGQCSLPEFYDNVRTLEKEEQLLYEGIEFDIEKYRSKLGRDLVFNAEREANSTCNMSVKEKLLRDRWCRPSISITGVRGSIVNPSIIPRQANASLCIRTVPDQNPLLVQSNIYEHLQSTFEAFPTSNKLSIQVKSNVKWWLGDVASEYFRQAKIALEKHWNKPPAFVREGGTSPNTSFLEGLFRAPCLHFPLGQSSDQAHLQNERLRLKNLTIGKNVLMELFAAISRKPNSSN